MKTNIIENTVKKNYCSGCGICANTCSENAIRIKYDETKQYTPIVNEEVCVNCGKCIDICSNSVLNKNKCIQKLEQSSDPISVGLENVVGSYRCKVRNTEELMRSASGGFVTEFSKRLLRDHEIDCVVHAERRLSANGEEHYRSCISRSEEELDARRSSVYGPVCFNNSLKHFANKSEKILIIGTPCVIRTVKNLFNLDAKYKNNQILTIALVCSHNVTGQFVDFFAGFYGISDSVKYTTNLRAKPENMKDRHDFVLSYVDGTGKQIVEEDRQYFNPAWRNYYFAMPACHSCPDLWGWEADISTKDCWEEEGNKDKYGSSLVIFRNKLLMKKFYNMKEFEISEISYDRIRVCEYPAAVYKQRDIIERIRKPENQRLNLTVDSIDKFSKGESKKIESEIRALAEKNSSNININIKMRIKSVIRPLIKTRVIIAFAHWVKSCLMAIISIFKPYEKKKYKKILMLGGFDGGNAGDEAQIDETINIMMNRYPDCIIKVLSHVQHHTWVNHYHCVVGPNPRVSIWDMDVDSYLYCSQLRNSLDRFRFLIKGYWCCFNAYLIKHGLPTLLINSKKVSLIEDIRTSDLLYISGGGTMTGDTLSRCWDNLFCMKIADIFNVSYALSGQNSGNWDSRYTMKQVKKAYNKALAVTFRDVYAIDNVRKLGVERSEVFTMFDDALFCDKLDDVSDKLALYGVSGEYIALNIHYWGIDNDTEAQKNLLSKIIRLCDYMYEKTGLDILLVPMSNTDEQPIEDFIGVYNNKHYIKVARYSEYDFRLIRALLSKAKYCITMKHHPIIFAVGECVPTISIAYKPYYTYKNAGALEIFGLGKYNIDIEKDTYFEEFEPLFDDLCCNDLKISQYISSVLPSIKERREKLFRLIDKELKEN